MVDITKDLETVDSEPEEDVTPLDENYFGKAFNFPVNWQIFFIQNDNDVERALKFQRDLKFCMSGYRELYKELVPSQSFITDYLVKEKKSLKFLKKHYHVDLMTCQVIYSQFVLAIHQNDHQARRRFVEWAPNEIAVVPDFHKRILFSDEAHFWLNGYVNKQNCRIWSEANPQVYVETTLHPETLTVWCALWAGGILLQKR
ncbi:uncharacterized protein TNCV_4541131 [Trichonephila clavipes]|nr:uncharacterized protein TNCV_4541131 [Trichonephila clavipes]